MPYIENLDELVEDIADKCGVYGTPPEGDHPEDCPCRMCFVIGFKDRIRALINREIKEKLMALRAMYAQKIAEMTIKETELDKELNELG